MDGILLVNEDILDNGSSNFKGINDEIYSEDINYLIKWYVFMIIIIIMMIISPCIIYRKEIKEKLEKLKEKIEILRRGIMNNTEIVQQDEAINIRLEVDSDASSRESENEIESNERIRLNESFSSFSSLESDLEK